VFHRLPSIFSSASQRSRGRRTSRLPARPTVRELERRDVPAPLTFSAGVNLPAAVGYDVAVPYATSIGTYSMVLGGTQNSAAIFLAATPTWNTFVVAARGLDQARVAPGVGTLANGDVIVFGGRNGDGTVLASALDWNHRNAKFPAMQTARDLFGFATDENHDLYAVGGKGNNGTLSSVEQYNPATETWSYLASLPVALSGLSAVADGAGHVFAIGGVDGHGHLSSAVYRYTIATNTWDTVPSLPTATDNGAAVLASNGLIYYLGGVTSAGTTAHVESYNEATNTWTREADLPAAVSAEAATVDALGRIVIAGGINARGKALATVYMSQELNQPDAAPVITSTPPTTAPPAHLLYTGGLYKYQVLSTANPQATYTLVTAPAGMTINAATGLITWTASDAAGGTQTVTVEALNYAGTTTQTYTVNIAPAAPTGLVATGNSTSTIALSWTASTDPAVTSYSVYERFPRKGGYNYVLVTSGLTTTSYTITGLAEGSYHTYVVTDVNGAGFPSYYSAAANAVTWYAPSISGYLVNGSYQTGNPVAVTAGQTVQVQLAFNAGNPPGTFSVLTGPTTVSIDPNTGLIRYTPAASEVGTVDITFQLSNTVGSATITIEFDVSA
jgi:hypothetical protein